MPRLGAGGVLLSRRRQGVFPPAGPGFSPLSLSPAAWWDFSSLALADGAAIATVPDGSGNGRTLTQAVGASKPIYKTAIQNGRDIARFDGAATFFDVPSLAALTAATAFLVVKVNVDPPATTLTTGLWDLDAATGASSSSHFPFTDGIVYDSFGSTARKTVGNPTPALTAFHIYEIKSIAGNWTALLDGAQIFTTATNTVGFSATGFLGKSFDGTTNYFCAGDMGELLLYGSGLNTTDADSVRAFLKSKWATP